MSTHRITATVTRDGPRFWLVHVPEIDQHTQSRSLDGVDTMARDLVATWFDVAITKVELVDTDVIDDAV